ncbi:hypothetical protein [Brevirhabdus sp.]|uniref:hypothetical protein n=1 Tax=Brevirhabdus sp. TaxID=2004514 RepID=UPI00405854CC
MTALTEYERLESPGIWRSSPEAQRRDVTVSVGNATLVLSDQADRALAHWSLPAVERINPGKMPALFSPDPQADETLEIDEPMMIAAIEKVRTVIRKRRPRQGRLRTVGFAVSVTAMLAFGFLVLPGVVLEHTANVVPLVKRQEIGRSLLGRISALTGGECRTTTGAQALSRLAARLSSGEARETPRTLMVMRGSVPGALHLPGGLILLDRSLVEDYDDPEVAAGYVLREMLKSERRDPLVEMLRSTGLVTTLRLLTTGQVSDDTLQAYAQELLTQPSAPVPDFPLLAAFGKAGVASTPFAYALDVTGETTLPLIEADPMQDKSAKPLLGDSDWVRLQDICAS